MARKYGNWITFVDGYRFDSKAEAERYQELSLLRAAGEITGLVVHPKYQLQASFEYKGKTERPVYYEADFQYFDEVLGKTVVEDVKGARTAVYKLKRKLFLAKYGQQYEFMEVRA